MLTKNPIKNLSLRDIEKQAEVVNLGFLYLVIDGLLQVSFVAVREPVDGELRLSLVRGRRVWMWISERSYMTFEILS